MPRRSPRPPTLLTRVVATLAVALVLVLAVLAASPELHERLHGHAMAAAAHPGGGPSGAGQSADDEDGCVVTLFAQGLILALALVLPAFTGQTLRVLGSDPRDRVVPAEPRYLRLPTQAPPVSLS